LTVEKPNTCTIALVDCNIIDLIF